MSNYRIYWAGSEGGSGIITGAPSVGPAGDLAIYNARGEIVLLFAPGRWDRVVLIPQDPPKSEDPR